jgi:murein DD-endopeptidase MepM/ murein hydrolase activator NlpD
MEDDPQEQKLYKQCLAEVNRIEDEKTKLASSLALAEGSKQSLEGMLEQTRKAVVDNRAHQVELKRRIHDLVLQEAATRVQMDATRARLALRRQQFAAFVRRSYKNADTLWATLFNSGGIADFLAHATAIVQLQAYGRDLLLMIRAEESRLQQQTDQLHANHEAATNQQKQLVAAEQQLVADEVRVSVILTALQGSIQDGQKELVSADTQTADLVAKIVAAQIEREDQLIQAANDAAWHAAQAWMASNNAVFPPSSNHSTKYPMVWPVTSGSITLGFGPTDFTFEPPAFGAPHFHMGLDMANSSGTPVRAADDGVVAVASDSMLGNKEIGYGKHVIVVHRNGVMTLYGHLEGWTVKAGDTVQQGQVIGLMGSTGNSTGPHLHFEVRVNDAPTDPTAYLPPRGPNDFRQ